MSKSKSKFTTPFKVQKNMQFSDVITKCHDMFFELNDLALRHCDSDLRDIEYVQQYLYECAMEAACNTQDSRYNMDHDMRLLRMRQIIKKF